MGRRAVRPPHREADLRPLELLHDGLKRLRFARRRGRKLFATVKGKELLGDPPELHAWLLADLGAQDDFTDAIAATIAATLAEVESATTGELTQLAHAAALRQGWHDLDGNSPSLDEVSWIVPEVLARGEGYGIFRRPPRSDAPGWGWSASLTEIGAEALARVRAASG